VLKAAADLARQRKLSDLEQQGLIQAFEFTHELAWNTLKDFRESRGTASLYGSKDATREAFARGLIANGDEWMAMIESRNRSSHTYNQETANENGRRDLVELRWGIRNLFRQIHRPGEKGAMTACHGLSENTVARIAAVLECFPAVESAVLFGSRAKGTHKPGSDIDLALVGASLDWRTVGKIYDALDDRLMPHRFSLIVYDEKTDPAVAAHIGRVGIPLFQRGHSCEALSRT